ncbi:MAG TPA: hypothetical protein VK467_05765 [Gemmatimonadales bacterium]|nr:hypothetical protein [Gemmatimonadales bacterium]
MRRSSSISACGGFAIAALLWAAQGPGTRVTYRVRVVQDGMLELARGSVSGPAGTDLRFALRDDTAEVEALFQIVPEGDTVVVSAEFFTKRRVNRSRRGLGLWEQDSYRRSVRLAWGDTARVHLFGRPRPAVPRDQGLWVQVVLVRGFSGGEGRPAEELEVLDSTMDIVLEAVVRPRRARVVMNLVRGDTVSGPRGFDLVPEAPARRVQMAMAGRTTTLEIGLARPEPARSARDRVLALDADVVCLRIATPEVAQPVGVVCGRLNDVARRLPLPGGDTLVATFAWPAGR